MNARLKLEKVIAKWSQYCQKRVKKRAQIELEIGQLSMRKTDRKMMAGKCDKMLKRGSQNRKKSET